MTSAREQAAQVLAEFKDALDNAPLGRPADRGWMLRLADALERVLATTFEPDPSDPGRCRHCGQSKPDHDPWPACDADLVARFLARRGGCVVQTLRSRPAVFSRGENP